MHKYSLAQISLYPCVSISISYLRSGKTGFNGTELLNPNVY